MFKTYERLAEAMRKARLVKEIIEKTEGRLSKHIIEQILSKIDTKEQWGLNVYGLDVSAERFAEAIINRAWYYNTADPEEYNEIELQVVAGTCKVGGHNQDGSFTTPEFNLNEVHAVAQVWSRYHNESGCEHKEHILHVYIPGNLEVDPVLRRIIEEFNL